MLGAEVDVSEECVTSWHPGPWGDQCVTHLVTTPGDSTLSPPPLCSAGLSSLQLTLLSLVTCSASLSLSHSLVSPLIHPAASPVLQCTAQLASGSIQPAANVLWPGCVLWYWWVFIVIWWHRGKFSYISVCLYSVESCRLRAGLCAEPSIWGQPVARRCPSVWLRAGDSSQLSRVKTSALPRRSPQRERGDTLWQSQVQL